MRKRLRDVWILILICIGLFAYVCNKNTPQTNYITAYTIMRADTYENSHALAYLQYGDSVLVKQKFDTYAKIEKNGDVGYVQTTYLKNEKPTPICKEDGFVYTIVVNIVNEQLAKVDNTILDKFETDGFSIHVTEEDLSKRVKNTKKEEHVLGLTSYKTSHILIGNSVHDAYDSTLHELGHWIDYDFDFTSDSKLFQWIYGKEKKQFEKIFDYTITDTSELFADGFFHYIDDAKMLKETCPCLYYYLNAVYFMEKTF